MDSIPQSSDSDSENLTTFSCFPKLPTELRLKIWHFFIPADRELILRAKNDPSIKGQPSFRGWFINNAFHGQDRTQTFASPIPTILHVNHEAREVGLTSYELAFGNCHRAGTAYVDFERDNVKLTYAGSNPVDMFLGGGFWGADDAEKIRVLEFKVEPHTLDMDDFCWEHVRQFDGLRRVSLIIYEEFIDEGEIPGMRRRLRAVADRHPEWKIPIINIHFGNPSMKERPWITL